MHAMCRDNCHTKTCQAQPIILGCGFWLASGRRHIVQLLPCGLEAACIEATLAKLFAVSKLARLAWQQDAAMAREPLATPFTEEEVCKTLCTQAHVALIGHDWQRHCCNRCALRHCNGGRHGNLKIAIPHSKVVTALLLLVAFYQSI